MMNQVLRKTFEPGRIYKIFIRQHQFKPKDKSIAFDAPLPKDLQAQSKDILLFRYENPNKISRNNVIAMMLVPMYTFMASTMYDLRTELTQKRKDQVADILDKKQSGWAYKATIFSATKYVGALFFVFGVTLSGYWISRSMHTVRRIVLRKGGKYVTIVTYGLFGYTSRYATKHISQCSAIRQNYQADQRLFLNVKGNKFRYQINVQDGIFSNKPLFDRTVGITRDIG